jgi:plastocyanin
MASRRPTSRSRTLTGITLLAGLVLAAACNSGSPSETLTDGPAAPSAAGGAPSIAAEPSEPGAQSGEVTVTIAGRSFGGDITITAGSSVVFVNHDGFGHTATNGSNGAPDPNALFDESLADGASTAPIVFDTPGTYQVTCRIHSSMNMTITVQ